jgi:hypothetical protein
MIAKSASILAKQYRLEHYLGKPEELNETIFRLLLLQETLQLEQARKKESPAENVITVTRKAAGKFSATCRGDARYRYAAETALKQATATIPVFQRVRFILTLRSMGVPESIISDFSNSVTMEDDTVCIDQE